MGGRACWVGDRAGEPAAHVQCAERACICSALQCPCLICLPPNLTPADGALGFLTSLAALQHLDLSGCKELTPGGLQPLAALPQLESLKLQHCSGLRGPSALQPLSALARLSALSLGGCTQIYGQALRALRWVLVVVCFCGAASMLCLFRRASVCCMSRGVQQMCAQPSLLLSNRPIHTAASSQRPPTHHPPTLTPYHMQHAVLAPPPQP